MFGIRGGKMDEEEMDEYEKERKRLLEAGYRVDDRDVQPFSKEVLEMLLRESADCGEKCAQCGRRLK